jgi:phage protein D
MSHAAVKLKIDGQEDTSLYENLVDLEVELDDELAAMFRLRFAITLDPSGRWDLLDERRLTVWKPLSIDVEVPEGFASALTGGSEELIDGVVTHVRPSFDQDLSQCTLEIWGMDRSVLLDREEKLKAWPDKNDSDIASEIFTSYGLSPQVERTDVIHDAKVSTIIQRETDMQFLRRLALRNGFECFVEGRTGYFLPLKSPPGRPLPPLNAPVLNHLSLEVNALVPARVTMAQVSRETKDVLEVVVANSKQPAQGTTDAAALMSSGRDRSQVVVERMATTGQPEMQALCQSLYHQGEWFVSGEGTIAGDAYGHVLKPRRTITINGIGRIYSGSYYLTHVSHRFMGDGYTQFFRVKRNALS